MNISSNYQNGIYYYSAQSNLQRQVSPSPASNSTDVSQGSNRKVNSKSQAGKVECETCKSRKYVDGSSDPGVSFKTPGHIDPRNSAAKVMSHEMEHVNNARAEASQKNREIVYQSVKLETSICPECGSSYVSGGTTTTVSKSAQGKSDYFKSNYEKQMAAHFGKEIDLYV
ncbi:MAG: hypothetical protein BWY74_01999 [Firmicutes bacterium ADurb.Bin419]|nr:MAG: hypothetical protein BWY74_01999 [Firmicutes bacterium ADurb.Bin419]